MVRGGGGGVGKPLKHKIRLDMKNLGPAPPLVRKAFAERHGERPERVSRTLSVERFSIQVSIGQSSGVISMGGSPV